LTQARSAIQKYIKLVDELNEELDKKWDKKSTLEWLSSTLEIKTK
jgi:hypothetical protein